MNAAGIFLAALAVAIMVIPWGTRSPEVDLREFDRKLIGIDERGSLKNMGEVRVNSRQILLWAKPDSQPTVHLVTSRVPFSVTFSVTVLVLFQDPFPFQVRVWNPRAAVAAEAWYAPNRTIVAGVYAQGNWRRLLPIGQYGLGSTQLWQIERNEDTVSFRIRERGRVTVFEIQRDEFPQLLQQEALSLSLYASAPLASSSVTAIHSPIITVKRQSVYGGSVRTRWFRFIVILTGVLGAVWLAATVMTRVRIPKWRAKEIVTVFVLVLLSGAVGWQLLGISGHPFEKRVTLLWSSIAREHGLNSIIARSMLATEADAHGGPPYEAVGFLYPPLLLYVYWLVGTVAPVAYAWHTLKAISLIALALGGALLYRILRRVGISSGLAAVTMAIYVLNPATIFDAAVWGQTDALVSLFLFLGAAGVIVESPPLVWAGTLIGLLIKQTGLLFGLMIVIIAFVRCGVRVMVAGLTPAVISVFVLLTPLFISGVHPSAIYRSFTAAIDVFGREASSHAASAVVSQGGFTFWTLVTIFDGAAGLARHAFPDTESLLFGLSYYSFSRGIFLTFVLLLVVLVVRRRPRSLTPGAFLLTIATYAVAAVVLLTRVQPRYLHFGVHFATAAIPWMPRWLGAAVLVVLSGHMLVGMWGMLALAAQWHPGLLVTFDPDRSVLNKTMAYMLTSDASVTIGSVLTVLSLLGLATALGTSGRRLVLRCGKTSAPRRPDLPMR